MLQRSRKSSNNRYSTFEIQGGQLQHFNYGRQFNQKNLLILS